MMTEQQLIERLLELQEHSDQLTDEQLQQVLDDPQMRELVEQLAFTKRAFKDKEYQTENPHVEQEWKKFTAKNFDKTNRTKHSYPFRKIAAITIGVLLVSSIAIAAIHIVRITNSHKTQAVMTEQTMSSKSSTPLPTDTIKTDTIDNMQPIVFDNIPLEKMLHEIGAHYDAKVTFINDEARQLRFRFVWNPQKGIEQVINDLNQFESLTITLKEKTIFVE
jgi:hypothetical protein